MVLAGDLQSGSAFGLRAWCHQPAPWDHRTPERLGWEKPAHPVKTSEANHPPALPEPPPSQEWGQCQAAGAAGMLVTNPRFVRNAKIHPEDVASQGPVG